jgi:DNA-binding transcriptional LysR family regulator
MLNTIHLRTLLAVLRTGTFADAARELNYTASAVSQQIAALERTTGVELFEREAHGIRPTSFAYLLRDRSAPLVARLDELQDEVSGLSSGRRGRLRLGSFPTASTWIVPEALSDFLTKRPLTQVLLDEGEPEELLPALMDGVLDIALVYEYAMVPRAWPEGLSITEIRVEDLILLLPAAHRRAGVRGLVLEDLSDDLWIAAKEGAAGSLSLQRLCASAGFSPHINFRSNNYDVIRGLVRAGLGVALVPALGYRPVAGVSARLTRLRGAVRCVRALYRTKNANPVLRDALDALVAASAACVDLPPSP